jgi:comEA protein
MRRASKSRVAAILIGGLLCAVFALNAVGGDKKKVPPSKPLDINAATSDELQELPGIGPVIAQRILDYRKKSGPFRNVDELMAVRGISDKRLAKIKPYVYVKNPQPTPGGTPKKDGSAFFENVAPCFGVLQGLKPGFISSAVWRG